MNRKIYILIHIVGWLAFFCSPMMFIDHSSNIDMLRYLFFSMMPFVLMVVFYINYFWLVPRYYIRGNHPRYYIINIISFVVFLIFLHLWMDWGHHIFNDTPPHKHAVDFVENHKAWFFSIRDIFNMTFAAAMGAMLRLSENWHKSEVARQEAEKERTKAELSNLRSQIKPHFMLNTLNNIYALTSFSPERAQKAIEQLSSLLRHILYENERSEISINDEIDFIGNYISLMRLRVTNNVDINFVTDIPEDCNTMIAPMIFISLVENAFKHGISPTKPSFIHISISVSNNTVKCLIKNSNYPKLENDKSGHGIGLKQVGRRLELAYSGRYKWIKGVSEDKTTYTSEIVISSK